MFLALGLVWPAGAVAQETPTNPPEAETQKESGAYRIRRDVNLVVLHASVLDSQGHFVRDLKEGDFRVWEDKVEQKLSLFKREDIPVSLGLVIDNSASMREKRTRVNAAAITLVKASNPDDQEFVVNFNDDYYLDTEHDFTSDLGELKDALDRIDARGSTSLYDAIIGSLDHLKKGTKDKKVLLVITDGADNSSHRTLEDAVLEAQKSDAIIYAIGLYSQEDWKTSKRMFKKAKKALESLTEATGGLAFFPDSVDETESICTQIAHDIRNQYVLGYYPTNAAQDGSYRQIRVESRAHGRGRLSVRTRTGYYAKKSSSTD